MPDLITPFHFDTHEVRIHLDTDGDPWWILTDICHVLGLTNTTEVQKRLDEDALRKIEVVDSRGQHQLAWAVNESGLYAVIFRSNKPDAKRFQKWVFGTVLPQIRQTGSFQAVPPPVPQLPPSRTIEQDLDVVDQSITLLERLQLLDGRDRLFYADQVRNISRRGILPPVAAPSQQSISVPPGASISDRLYVVAPHLNAKEHRRLAILCGKLCAAEYRLRYPGMPINSFMQYVDGATRPVNWFLPGDWDWIDTILQARVATQGHTP